ncbi:hypothetical protein [Spiroplasma endosymbiont of Amphibalanus improvisus]|uniref:hypothetical protein n=1 Tax=Spiroplasma endosymbiont of Amphibalanus improvisus TaxID=3066327 RepID=UPI00313DCCE4
MNNQNKNLNFFDNNKPNSYKQTVNNNKQILLNRTVSINKPNLTNQTFNINKPNLTNQTVNNNKPNLTNQTVNNNKPNLTNQTFNNNKPNLTNQTFNNNKPNLTNQTFNNNKPNLTNQTFNNNKPSLTNQTFNNNKPSLTKQILYNQTNQTVNNNKPNLYNQIVFNNKPNLPKQPYPQNKTLSEKSTFFSKASLSSITKFNEAFEKQKMNVIKTNSIKDTDGLVHKSFPIEKSEKTKFLLFKNISNFTITSILILSLLVISVILVIIGVTTYSTISDGPVVLPANVFENLEEGYSTTYYESQEQAQFISSVDQLALSAINSNVSKTKRLTMEEVDFNWNDVQFSNEGEYNVGIEVNDKVTDKYYIPDIEVKIFSVMNLSDIDFSKIFNTFPYVTTETASYEKNVQNTVSNYFESKNVPSQDVDIKFSSKNTVHADHLNLSQSTQAGGANYGNLIEFIADPNSNAVVGDTKIIITVQAYDIEELLAQRRTPNSEYDKYEDRYNQIHLLQGISHVGYSSECDQYFNFNGWGVDTANSGKINHDIQYAINKNITEISDKNGLHIPPLSDNTYYWLLDFTNFPFEGSDKGYEETTTEPWTAEGNKNIWRNEDWTRNWELMVRPNNGVFIGETYIWVTFST